MNITDITLTHALILELEAEGKVKRTFRRLDPQRQQQVIQAILDEAAEKGPQAVSIKEVARRAEVSVGALYTYFPHRQGMLDFAIALATRYVCQQFAVYQPLLADLPLRQALQLYLQEGIAWSQQQAGYLQLFARAAYHGHPELAQVLVTPVASALLETVRQVLQAASQRGELRQPIDLEATARLLHGLFIVVGDSQLLPYLNHYFQITSPQVSLPRIMDGLVDLVLHGLQPNQQEEGTK